MKKTKILVHKMFCKAGVDSRIYGSFVEHMGRVVYSGIYEPGHAKADEDGFRMDVIQKTRDMGVTAVRYPGGNFVSNYNWMDGIGPVKDRPRKRDLAWKSIETNEVGTDEFMRWAAKARVEPVFAVNLGTKGIEEALSLLEYCNLPAGTYYSDLRCQYGRKEPYGIKTWCLGNEMDGIWQIGHKTAEEYGRLAYETGKAMKLLDPSIELVVCGSSMSTNATFGEWERVVLSHTYECADYISLHQYYGGQEKGTAGFLAQSLDMERYIRTVAGICDMVKAQKHSSKQINICFDEWGVWSIPDRVVQEETEKHPWQIAPSISEQIYTMEDALLFASMLFSLVRNSGRVKIACQSLLTNISACIMTKRGGDVWVQPNFYPFAYLSAWGRGIVMDTRLDGPSYEVSGFSEVPYVDHLVVCNPEKSELAMFFVNRAEEKMQVEIDIEGFEAGEMIESVVLCHKDKKATNQENHECVRPEHMQNFICRDGQIQGELEPLSFQMLRFSVGM